MSWPASPPAIPPAAPARKGLQKEGAWDAGVEAALLASEAGAPEEGLSGELSF